MISSRPLLVEGSTGTAVVAPAASALRDEVAMSGQRLLAASGQIPMAAHMTVSNVPRTTWAISAPCHIRATSTGTTWSLRVNDGQAKHPLTSSFANRPCHGKWSDCLHTAEVTGSIPVSPTEKVLVSTCWDLGSVPNTPTGRASIRPRGGTSLSAVIHARVVV
jgi:hypothetical protein